MNYPELLLIPVAMLLDYYLTILGEIYRKKGYNRHFKVEHYELNPSFQSEIKNIQRISPKFLLRVALVSIILIVLLEIVAESIYVDLILGYFLVSRGTIIGAHLSNIVIFRSIIQNPQQLSGEVSMNQDFLLISSMVKYLVVWVPLVIILVFSPSYFLAGGVLGTTQIIWLQYSWLRKLRKTNAKASSEF